MMSDHLLTVRQAQQKGQQLLSTTPGTNNALESAILLAHTLDKDRAWLFAWPEKELTQKQQHSYLNYLQRRLSGEPVSYITGKREFWNLELKVTTDTLVPRPETELLIETAIERITDKQPSILELGTGTGAISAALATEKPHWKILATDINAATLEIAKQNFAAHELAIRVLKSDWFVHLSIEKFDLIISNPPYIEVNDPHLSQGDLRFEPAGALVSGEDGLDAIREITGNAGQYLKHGGWLMLEHGYNQGKAVYELFQQAQFSNIQTLNDLSMNDRITIGQLR
jgi:release factor glutamine methyltransferase